jgi:serine protease AprX
MLSPQLNRLAAALLVLLAGSVPAQGAAGPKLDKALQLVQTGASERVIVQVTPGSRAKVRRLLQSLGATIQAEHPSVDGITADVPAAALRVLSASANVTAVGLDAEVTSTAAVKNKANLAQVHTSVLRTTLGLGAFSPRGLGIGVAVIDSGIAPLPAFANRITAFYDFTNGALLRTTPRDEYGHGTHVAGLIGGQQLAGDYEFEGVAPAVHFVGIKVLDKNGRGRTSDVIRALEFVAANQAFFNIRVVNLSLGHPILAPAASDPLVQAVERAVRKGLVVVVSAGNFGMNPETDEMGYAGITSPGNAPSAITVGAVDTKQTITRSDDEVTRYSSRGPSWYDAFAKPDVVAPGHALTAIADASSYLYKQYPSLRREGSGQRKYIALSGTSMATGVTTGVIATILEANAAAAFQAGGWTRLSANAVKGLLQYTATAVNAPELTTDADALTQGAGEINADGAIRLASLLDPRAEPNATWIDMRHPTATPYSTIGGETEPWSSMILWGDAILWGESIAVNTMAWDNNIVWGMDDNIVWGMNTSWGDNIVWGMNDNTVWGENIVWGEGLLTALMGDNIVWGMVSRADNIVWGELSEDNIVWGMEDDNIVWGMDLAGGLR